MNIPKSFMGVNRKWHVHVLTARQIRNRFAKTELNLPDPDTFFGLCVPDTACIYLNKDQHATREFLEHTFCHEMAHAMYFGLGKAEHDEQEIDALGGILHQMWTTQRGEQ